VRRARLTNTPGCSGSTPNAHDAQLIARSKYLKNEDASGLDIRILAPVET
jgi:monomeric isocitrate dehydrogenase